MTAPSNDSNHDDGSSGNKKDSSIRVALRMRPLNEKESSNNSSWIVVPGQNAVALRGEGETPSGAKRNHTYFSFDKTFDQDTTTEDVYSGIASDVVAGAISGLNGTIFAYGQTSSGKTFTMQGDGCLKQDSENGTETVAAAPTLGVVQLAARQIFAAIESEPNRDFLIRTSFVEIYNEEVRDLLPLEGRKTDTRLYRDHGKEKETPVLAIHESKTRGIFVDCNETLVTDAESLVETLFAGESNRVVASTLMNARSSRSHTVFRITIESRETSANGDEDEAVLVSTLNLVDLAGSESARHTGASGQQQREGGKINQSLLALTRVIEALGRQPRGYVNYRDSKLTRLLQPCLQGNSSIAIVCCATPSELYVEETRSTLQFASRARLVKTSPKKNEVMDDQSLIRRLRRELEEARRALKERDQMHHEQHKVVVVSSDDEAEVKARLAEEKVDALKSMIRRGGMSIPQQQRQQENARQYPRSATLSPAMLAAMVTESCLTDEDENSLDDELQGDMFLLEKDNGNQGDKVLWNSVAVFHYDHHDETMPMFENANEQRSKGKTKCLDDDNAIFQGGKRKESQTTEVELLKEALKSKSNQISELKAELNRLEAECDRLSNLSDQQKVRIEELETEVTTNAKVPREETTVLTKFSAIQDAAERWNRNREWLVFFVTGVIISFLTTLFTLFRQS